MPELPHHQLEYWYKSQYLGARPIRVLETNWGLHALLQHTLFVCSLCGNPWGRRLWRPHDLYNRGPIEWKVSMRLCSSEPDTRITLPGSLLEPGECQRPWIYELPIDLLRHHAYIFLDTVPIEKPAHA